MPIYSDVDLELNKKRDGDIVQFEETGAIVSSITNILGTMQGSRRMLPEFALPIFNLLFEPIDDTTAYMIAENLISAINVWDDRIIIKGVNIEADEDNNKYDVSLTMIIKESSQEVEIKHILRGLA